MHNKICIIDYGIGNVNSVKNAFDFIGTKCTISGDKNIIKDFSHLVLPGVGSFSRAMNNLKERNLIKFLFEEVVVRKKKILGICLGMQLFATWGNEYGKHKGLNLIEGEVVKIDTSLSGLHLPHVGWNNVKITKKHLLTNNFTSDPSFYFVHSYCFQPKDASVITAICDYGNSISAIVEHENVFGTQFHPEKSQKDGLNILSNFSNIT